MERARAAASLGRRLLGRSARRSRAGGQLPPQTEEGFRAPDSPGLVEVPRSEAVAGGPAARLTVLMPHLQLTRMTGGPNTIINLTGRLVDHDLAVRYVATFGPMDRDPGPLRAHISALTGSEKAGRQAELISADGPIPIASGDVLMATWWPTAYVAREAMKWNRAREFIYLIQDFEPGFYAWSTNYALASATYDFPCRAVFNERLLRAHFAAGDIGRFGPNASGDRAVAFDPSVDRRLFRRPASDHIPSRARGRRLVFYARPRTERNCYALGLRALRTAVQEGAFDGEDWEFVAIGADLPELALSDRHTLRPSGWLGYADYAQLLSQSDLLLSLMLSPHTSYPPLEMAAAGNLVVTNVLGAKTADALQEISPRIVGVNPTVEDLVAAMRHAAATIRAGRVPTGDIALPETWTDALADAVPWLARTVRVLAAGSPADPHEL